MHITFAPRAMLQINEARIIFRNFSGEATKFNTKGNRNFAVVIDDQELADKLEDLGWNIKVRPPRDEGDEPFMYLPVKIKFNERGPKAYLESGSSVVHLDEESIDCLDDIDIVSADLDIRPYDWEVNGKTGRTAYLQSIRVIQEVDRFASKYGTKNDRFEEDEEGIPF